MVPQCKEEIPFHIKNEGKIGFYFTWSVKEDSVSSSVKAAFGIKEGYIMSEDEAVCPFTLVASSASSFKRLKIKLQVYSLFSTTYFY